MGTNNNPFFRFVFATLIWEGHGHKQKAQSSDSGGSLNGSDLFTELPFL